MRPIRMFGVFDAGVDGRSWPVLKAICEQEGAAHDLAGAYRSVQPIWALGPTAHGRYYILRDPEPMAPNVDFDQQRNDARAVALAKLSPEDRRALGLESEP